MEAILVAVIVLTAVLFFTSVQRPTSGSESRGVDLGPVATDTLGILQRRSFTNPATYGDPEDWVTQVLSGNAATASTVDDFVTQVLPSGAKHFVRLSNGIGSVDLLPTASPGKPQGARAAEVPLFPHWRAFWDKEATDVAAPGQPVASSNAVFTRFLDPADTITCIKAPYNAAATSLWRTPQQLGAKTTSGSTTVTGLSTAKLAVGMRVTGTGIPASTTIAGIPTGAAVTLSNAATATGSPTLSFYENRIPAGAVYGTWAGYTASDCSGTPTAYAAVVLPGAKVVTGLTWVTTSKTLNAAAATFTSADLGRLIVGPGIPGGTIIAKVNSTTQVQLSLKPTVAGANAACTLASNPTYPIYGLQLVVWFGA